MWCDILHWFFVSCSVKERTNLCIIFRIASILLHKILKTRPVAFNALRISKLTKTLERTDNDGNQHNQENT